MSCQRFDRAGNFTCVAGETVRAALQIAGPDGELSDLSGRVFVWRVFDTSGEGVVPPSDIGLSPDGIAALAAGTLVEFQLPGTVTQGLKSVGLRHEIAELTDGGRVVWVSGQFSVLSGASFVSRTGSVGDDVVTADDRGTVLIVTRGAPGQSAWAASGQTLAQYNSARAAEALQAFPGQFLAIEPEQGTAVGGETEITAPIAVPTDTPWLVDVYWTGLAQRPGMDFTSDGTTTLQLNFTLAAGESWMVKLASRVLA